MSTVSCKERWTRCTPHSRLAGKTPAPSGLEVGEASSHGSGLQWLVGISILHLTGSSVEPGSRPSSLLCLTLLVLISVSSFDINHRVKNLHPGSGGHTYIKTAPSRVSSKNQAHQWAHFCARYPLKGTPLSLIHR